MSLEDLQSLKRDVISRVTAAKLKVEDDHPDISYIDATAGVVCNPETGKPYVPSFFKKAAIRLAQTNKANTYNFAGDQPFLRGTAQLIFGDDIEGIGMWPAAGGSHSIYLGNKLIAKANKTDMQPEVVLGTPTWPGHKGIIEEAGGRLTDYPYLDEKGEFNAQAFFDKLKRRVSENPEVTVLLHGVCQNPLGIDVPQKYWKEIAGQLLRDNIKLQIDLAYLGFGKNIEEDSAMIRYFRKQGVKMMVYFSGSKFYNAYGETRIGAGYAVNFPNTTAIQDNALGSIRPSTSAIALHGQKMGNMIETHDDLRGLHRQWLDETNLRVAGNRGIISDAMEGYGFGYLRGAKGIFHQQQYPNPEEIAGQLFPELGEVMGWTSGIQHDEQVARVATVPVAGEGVRLNLGALNNESSTRVAEALQRVWH